MASILKVVPRSSHPPRACAARIRAAGRGFLPADALPPLSWQLLNDLLGLHLVSSELAERFLDARADKLGEYTGERELGAALVESGLITSYQLERVLSGSTHGLLLGNYRVLQQIGTGGMGLVYLAEHCLMRRRVAVKVVPVDDDCDPSLKQRFYAEMRLLAELNHPNIVQAFDAGELAAPGPNMPALSYLAMEFVPGGNLEEYVEHNGPVPVARACDFIRQAAQGLQAAHDLHVIHRDVKPSNLLLANDGQVKLVDFGLARQFCSQLTDPRALLGSVEFMPPEQSHDPSGVGPEADVYGLGATLFWMLCGEAPYPLHRNIGSALRELQSEPPRRLRDLLPNVLPELDDLIARMLDRDPLRRPTPLAVGIALTTLVHAESNESSAFAEQYRLSNSQLERSLEASRNDLRQAHDALLFAMAKMAESRDGETSGHVRRLQRYVQVLAETAAQEPPWLGLVDERFLQQVIRCIPLHDIGKIGLPDDVLLKPASLSAGERQLVETHPAIGDRILESLGKEHGGTALDFLGAARAIVRHHHERYDGRGYPDRLAGDSIPPMARLAAVADVYDALRRDRLHRAALPHAAAVQIILRQSLGQFDPSLLAAFERCHSAFERIYLEVGD